MAIDVDYDDYIMSAEDDQLSHDQKEWRKMLREDMQKEYGNGKKRYTALATVSTDSLEYEFDEDEIPEGMDVWEYDERPC